MSKLIYNPKLEELKRKQYESALSFIKEFIDFIGSIFGKGGK